MNLVPASVGLSNKAKNTSNTDLEGEQKRRKSIEIKGIPNNNNNNNNSPNKNNTMSNNNNNNHTNYGNDIYESFGKPTAAIIPTDTTFMFEKECRPSVSTVVGVSNEVNVVINDHSVLTGSLFSRGGSHIIMYAVNTQPFNWIVKRKY